MCTPKFARNGSIRLHIVKHSSDAERCVLDCGIPLHPVISGACLAVPERGELSGGTVAEYSRWDHNGLMHGDNRALSSVAGLTTTHAEQWKRDPLWPDAVAWFPLLPARICLFAQRCGSLMSCASSVRLVVVKLVCLSLVMRRGARARARSIGIGDERWASRKGNEKEQFGQAGQ
jgi:hypothetical protein